MGDPASRQSHVSSDPSHGECLLKICTKLLILALEFHNIKNISVKYSGGTGFHVGVPFESFPESINGELIKRLFPYAAQRIAAYLSEMIKEKLAEQILMLNDLATISERTAKPIMQ